MMSPAAFDVFYRTIDKEDPDLFYIERGVKYVDLEILIDELGFRGKELSEEDQYTLFDRLRKDGITVNGLPDDFFYKDKAAAASTPPPKRAPVALTPTYTFQGDQNTCFAHAAANMIIHNVYKLILTEPDTRTFIDKNCNQFLDTTSSLPDYRTLVENCGETGAMRIILFRYIYGVITTRYGFNRGPLGNSILFYLQQPFRPDILPEFNETIRPLFTAKPLDIYSLSLVPIDKFDTTKYGGYFSEYYASLHVRQPAHFFTIVGIDDEVRCKDSSTGKELAIPLKEFQSNGTVTIDDSRWQDMSFVYLLFETEKLSSYPDIVKPSIENAKVNPMPTPTRDLRARPDDKRAEELGTIRQPNFEAALDAEPSIADIDGGRKSRKRRKTRRKRNKKLKRLTRYKV